MASRIPFVLERTLVRLASRHASRAGRRPRPNPPERRAILLPTARPGSVGDQAMLQGLAHALSRRGFERIDVIRYRPGDDWGRTEPLFTGSVPWPRRTPGSWLGCARDLARASHFFTLGADVLDGHYGCPRTWRMLELSGVASALGLDTRICGFSLNPAPAAVMLEAFRALPSDVACFLRDPLSARRFHELTGRSALGSADLAFLLEPAPEDRVAAVLGRIHSERERGRTVLGLCLNFDPLAASLGMRADACPDDLLARIAANVDALLDAHGEVTVLFVPHDRRGDRSDDWLAAAVHERLAERSRQRALLVGEVLESDEIKTIAAATDCVLTGRMHFLIAALGSGVPGVGLAYQAKFEGLYSHFGLEGQTLPPDGLVKDGEILGAVARLLRDREGLRSHIAARLPDVRALAQRQLPEELPA